MLKENVKIILSKKGNRLSISIDFFFPCREKALNDEENTIRSSMYEEL